MIANAEIFPMLPVDDFKAARRFYEETLGLRIVTEVPGAVTYRSGRSSQVAVYESEFAGTNRGTAAAWRVDDVAGEVRELKAKGVAFEHYDLPGLKLEGDVHRAGESSIAWFKDPSGNILSIENVA